VSGDPRSSVRGASTIRSSHGGVIDSRFQASAKNANAVDLDRHDLGPFEDAIRDHRRRISTLLITWMTPRA